MTNQEFLESITQEGEEWQDIKGYEGRYAVSSKSRVVSFPRPHNPGRVLSPAPMSHGYNYISLYDANGKHRCIGLHRIVAESFIPNPNGYKYIDHINTIKTDNRIENLRWCTAAMNQANPLTRLCHSVTGKGRKTSKARGIVQHKDGKVIAIFRTAQEASVNFNNNFSSICACCRGEKSQYGGFQWSYLKDWEASCQ